MSGPAPDAEPAKTSRVAMFDEPKPAAAASRAAPPASGEVALAGNDGRELARVIRASKARGVSVMSDIVTTAIRRYKGFGPLLKSDEVSKLADTLAAVAATADLLGRSHVRDVASRALVWKGNHNAPPSTPFAKFADVPTGVIQTPAQAVEYFTSLQPELGIDPKRYGAEVRRKAFTMAASTSATLTARVQKIIADSLRDNASAADAAGRIKDALDKAGVTPKNPQYAEMVFRTNAMDSFQQGVYEEGRNPDVSDLFPAWEYLGIRDGRQGPDHEPHFGKLYPAHAVFADVRGPRPFNCRCSMRWVDQFELADLERSGRRVEGVM